MSTIVMRSSGAGNPAARCAAGVATWLEMQDPADIEDAITAFVPPDQPMRDEYLDQLVKILKLNMGGSEEDADKLMAVISAVTLRIVQRENATGRRSVSHAGRVTVDETLDLIKIVLVGNSGVGKTCIMHRFVKDEFASSTRATIGMDFCTRQLNVNTLQASESSVVQQLTVQVWDTAGQEQFHSLTSTYYRKAGGVMVMYDSSNRASYDSLRRWLEDVDSNSEGVVKMIVATKSDVPSVVPESEGKAFAAQNGCLFGTTSAKAGNGVIPAFQALAQAVLASQEQRERTADSMKESIILNQTRTVKKGGCC
uniref:Uncharacterized protein n=1 Tax=Haptolina ericina TaxID=156174 RepID=A0A7S3AFE2_9EUKA|mmetsp:Transcript_15773/g.35390  ORF Transcript_15773/g.35390 Transcript_15773/m.35390 type:complete len:311 (+) Transcript_15773:52-984(+)